MNRHSFLSLLDDLRWWIVHLLIGRDAIIANVEFQDGSAARVSPRFHGKQMVVTGNLLTQQVLPVHYANGVTELIHIRPGDGS
jgi:hypothetical protein